MPIRLNSNPNFFIIGAPKAGTSALYFCLKQHPEIYMSPVKEPNFFLSESIPPKHAGPKGDYFSCNGVFSPRDYLCLFAGANLQKAIGEASTTYLNSPIAATRISQFAPNARIIVLLRQPADRAYSHFQYLRSQGIEPVFSFAEALSLENARREEGWFAGHLYKESGFYCTQLRRYFDCFHRDQVRIYLYEEWNQAPHTLLQDLFRFLGVDERFVPEIRRNNVTLLPRWQRLNYLARRPERFDQVMSSLVPGKLRKIIISGTQIFNRKFNLYKPPPIDPEIRRQLTAGYREDILKLQDLIDRDLSHWLLPK